MIATFHYGAGAVVRELYRDDRPRRLRSDGLARARTTGTRSTPISTPRTPTKRSSSPTPRPRRARTCSACSKRSGTTTARRSTKRRGRRWRLPPRRAWQTRPGRSRDVAPRLRARVLRRRCGASTPPISTIWPRFATLLRTPPERDPPDYLFWADPFDPRIQARMQTLDLAGIRLRAERDPRTHGARSRAARRARRRGDASRGAALRRSGAALPDRQGGARLLRGRARARRGARRRRWS